MKEKFKREHTKQKDNVRRQKRKHRNFEKTKKPRENKKQQMSTKPKSLEKQQKTKTIEKTKKIQRTKKNNLPFLFWGGARGPVIFLHFAVGPPSSGTAGFNNYVQELSKRWKSHLKGRAPTILVHGITQKEQPKRKRAVEDAKPQIPEAFRILFTQETTTFVGYSFNIFQFFQFVSICIVWQCLELVHFYRPVLSLSNYRWGTGFCCASFGPLI